MKKKICSALAMLLLLLTACGNNASTSFDQYVGEIDALSDAELNAVFSEKSSMDDLIVGEPTSVITDDRWQKGINNDHYHASGIVLAGQTTTISIIQEDDIIQGVQYIFSPEGESAAQAIIEAAISGLGDPSTENESERVLMLSWSNPDLRLTYMKSSNRLTVD